MFLADLKFAKTAPKAGDTFPPFELVTTDGRCLINRDVFNDKPVLFVVGSITCPMTASSMPDVKKLYDELGGRIDFIMLQVREAHPGEYVPQPETMEEKLKHAQALKDFYDIQWTVAADNIDGDLHRALDPKPNSTFLADGDGTILFRSIWAGDMDAGFSHGGRACSFGCRHSCLRCRTAEASTAPSGNDRRRQNQRANRPIPCRQSWLFHGMRHRCRST
jgi:hypothetical protein